MKSPANLLAFFVFMIFVSVQEVKSETIQFQLEAPDFDRWMYPYNASPGFREVAPTFSSVGSGFDIFDDRDGQILLGFITQNAVDSGLGSQSYQINSLTINLTLSVDGIRYDPTVDAWDTYVPNGEFEDEDEGRPLELFGAAFRGDYDGWSFGETGSFPMGAVRRERNAYPVVFADSGEAIDVSNSVLDEFTPQPFAVGTTGGIHPGSPMPSETVLSFEVDVTDPNIQCYLRNSLNDGLLNFVVNSLHEATQPGFRNVSGLIYPVFHMKESLAVYYGLADAGQCFMEVTIDENPTQSEDINGDGAVTIADLLLLIGDWGVCYCCPSDINGDSEVDISDLLALISAWS